MEYQDNKYGLRVRVALTDEELQLPAIDDLCNKYLEYLKLSEESEGGRKTRSANRRADTILEEILAFKLPPIKLKQLAPVEISANSSVDGDHASSSVGSSSTSQTTRTLRPRCKTPTTPSTPTHQSIRTHMKKNLDSGSSSVLTAALNQQHPTVSATKLRQLLRVDSAQKKRDEERERQERLRQDRKAKEERAEAQKKQLLEERAITAKMKREQRLMHAAEVRKAREKQRVVQKLKDDHKKITLVDAAKESAKEPAKELVKELVKEPTKEPVKEPAKQPAKEPVKETTIETIKQSNEIVAESIKTHKLDETFQKPSTNEQNNIDISIHDETTDSHVKQKNAMVAPWAKAPYLRDAVITQFSKPQVELLKESYTIFMGEKLKQPVDLVAIFGPSRTYLCRTSSAVWSPPNRALKRSSSMVMTPTNNTKK